MNPVRLDKWRIIPIVGALRKVAQTAARVEDGAMTHTMSIVDWKANIQKIGTLTY